MKSNSRVERKVPGHRHVTGCFGDVGYIIKRPGHGIKTDKLLENFAEVRRDAMLVYKEIESLKKDRFLNEHQKQFDMKTVRASVNCAVQLGMDQLERDMAGKQNRLKSVLLGEQSEQVTEYTRKAQKCVDERKDATKRKAEDILKRKDDSERKRAQEVYFRMALENSDAYKSKLRMEQMKIGQEANKEMIRLKLLKNISDAEYDAQWNAEADKCSASLPTEKAVRKTDKAIKQHQGLMRQIEERKRLQSNEVCMEQINAQRIQLIQDEEYRKLDLRAEDAKRRELLGFQALAQQIGENKTLAAKNRQEELLIDQIMLNHNRKVLEIEQAAIRDERAQNWNELVIFKHAMVEFRNAWQDRSEDSERLVKEYAREIELKKYKARKAMENYSKDLKMACFEAAKLKAGENIVKQAASRQMTSEAGELVAHYDSVNNRLSTAVEKEKLTELNPAQFNDESLKYLKVLQERQQLEDRNMLENMKRQNDVHQRNVMRVLERPIQESYKHQHPMYRVLKSE